MQTWRSDAGRPAICDIDTDTDTSAEPASRWLSAARRCADHPWPKGVVTEFI